LYGSAIQDAEKAIELDPKFIKAYYRRAVGNIGLSKLKGVNSSFLLFLEAVKDLRTVTQVAPQDLDAKNKLKECEKELRRIEFEKAISADEVYRSALQDIGDIDSIHVEPSYDGPHLLDSGITLEFVESMLEYMRLEKKVHRKYIYKIMAATKEYFEKQGPIVDIVIPEDGQITVCGDIHGQYYDLLNIFKLNGLPCEKNKYLFNGDFVDRGSFSVECILALLAFKHLYPEGLYLSRGNHETNDMNRVYGFEKECKVKYTDLTFKLFSEIFNAIPLGNLIDEKILVIHGGLFSRDGVTIEEVTWF
jgi:serine/threonine-protein phosphatase 5